MSCTRMPTIRPPDTSSRNDNQSQSSLSPPSPSWAPVSSSAMPIPVSSLTAHPSLPLTPPNSVHPQVHTAQARRRWFIRHRLALRLAWTPPSEYTPLPDAVWRWRETRVGWKASRRRQEDEEAMGRRLGRVQKAQGARGASIHTPSPHVDFSIQ
jgi:hypothetical protein